MSPEQIFYRIYYPIKRRVYKRVNIDSVRLQSALGQDKIGFPKFSCDKKLYIFSDKSFCFLNKIYTFENEIDWNFQDYGLLWAFHLHYFDWLNDEYIEVNNRLDTIRQFIGFDNKGYIFENSFVISKRIINWVKFLIQEGIKDDQIINYLYQDAHRLADFPEYDISANHLLENAIALCWAGIYFKDEIILKRGTIILNKELNLQFLNDGAHFEKSIAYHSVILKNILELIFFIKRNDFNFIFFNKLNIIAEAALSHLIVMTCSGKYRPCFGDCNPKMIISFRELDNLAQYLLINRREICLSDSGLRRLDGRNFHLFFNSGIIPAFYQPGHTHADAFSVCLFVEQQPVIVDRGVSTYEKSVLRDRERSTEAHNTVCVEGVNSIDVWASFRVGARMKIKTLEDTDQIAHYEHDGYFSEFKIIHNRRIEIEDYCIIIDDFLQGWKGQKVFLYYHFHPDVTLLKKGEKWIIVNSDIEILIANCRTYIENYDYCEGFNETRIGQRIVAEVNNETIQTLIKTSLWVN